MPQCVAANATNASQSPDPPTPLIASIVLRERIVEGGIGSRVKHFFRRHFQAPNAIENGRGPNQRRAPLGKEDLTTSSRPSLSCCTNHRSRRSNRLCLKN